MGRNWSQMEGVETFLVSKDQNEMDMAGKIYETVRTLLSVILYRERN